MKEVPRDDWQDERGGRIDPLSYPKELDDDARIDQAIAESFPASDPPSWISGTDDDSDAGENDRDG